MDAEQVARARHRHHLRQLPHQGAGSGQIVDHGYPGEQPDEGREQLAGCRHDVDGVPRAGGQGWPAVRVVLWGRRGAAHQQARPSEVLRAQVHERIDGGIDRRHGDRVGRPAERAGHRGLVPGLDGQQHGDGPEQARDLVARGHQGPGSVLTGEAELQCLLAADQRGPVTLGLLLVVPEYAEALLHVAECRARGLVLGVETSLARVEARHVGLQRGELAARGVGPGLGLGASGGQPGDLVLAGLQPAAYGLDLPGQARESLAAVGGGPDQRLDPAFLLGMSQLLRLAVPDRLVQGRLVTLDLGGDGALLGAYPLGLGFELLWVSAGTLLLADLGQVPAALGGEAGGAAEALLQAGQPIPGLLGAGDSRGVGTQRLVEGGFFLLDSGERPFDRRPAFAQGVFVRHLLREGGAQLLQVVGEEPCPGIARVGLDHRGLAGHLRLPAERA